MRGSQIDSRGPLSRLGMGQVGEKGRGLRYVTYFYNFWTSPQTHTTRHRSSAPRVCPLHIISGYATGREGMETEGRGGEVLPIPNSWIRQ